MGLSEACEVQHAQVEDAAAHASSDLAGGGLVRLGASLSRFSKRSTIHSIATEAGCCLCADHDSLRGGGGA